MFIVAIVVDLKAWCVLSMPWNILEINILNITYRDRNNMFLKYKYEMKIS